MVKGLKFLVSAISITLIMSVRWKLESWSFFMKAELVTTQINGQKEGMRYDKGDRGNYKNSFS